MKYYITQFTRMAIVVTSFIYYYLSTYLRMIVYLLEQERASFEKLDSSHGRDSHVPVCLKDYC